MSLIRMLCLVVCLAFFLTGCYQVKVRSEVQKVAPEKSQTVDGQTFVGKWAPVAVSGHGDSVTYEISKEGNELLVESSNGTKDLAKAMIEHGKVILDVYTGKMAGAIRESTGTLFLDGTEYRRVN